VTAQTIEAVRVNAEPFRAHLGVLLDRTGLPWPVLALKADVGPVLVRDLLFGDRGRRLTELPRPAAERLLALDEPALRATGRRWVQARQARSDLSRLLADGFPPASLARYCRLTQTELRCALGAARCLELTVLLARSARLQYASLRSADALRAGDR
jgi:hypothetical protein